MNDCFGDLMQPGGVAADIAHQRNGFLDEPRGLPRELRGRPHLRLELRDPVDSHGLGGVPDFVDRIVHRRDQRR